MTRPETTTETQVTLAKLLLARRGDDRPGYLFEDERYTWDEVVTESEARAEMLVGLLDPSLPMHVGVLLDNEPEYLFLLGGAALAGAAIVGINPTRRGDELARDMAHTDCQFVITDTAHRDLLPDDPAVPVYDIATPSYRELIAADPSWSGALPNPDATLFLMFTSGSTSAPKAVACSNGRAGQAGQRVQAGYGVRGDDICYCQMPLFHGNALLACWCGALAAGATVVLRRKFSASGFLADVRTYRCTYFTYVGRAISYVLAQPESADDADNTLRTGFGTEASPRDRAEFERRFGCSLVEGYGSSESAIVITRTPDTPALALGVAPDPSADVAVIDPATSAECPRASFDADGGLVNGHDAIGELVNRAGGGPFAGYYNNPEATSTRLRGGWFWSGDLAYRDEDGFFYFAGRSDDRLRVDGENFSTEPIAALLGRIAGVAAAVVYAVPDEATGDQVMAALKLDPGVEFDPILFRSELESQSDLGTKWAPRYIRIIDQVPVTANHKVFKPALRREAFVCDRAWWRPDREADYEPLDARALDQLRTRYAAQGRAHLVEGLDH